MDALTIETSAQEFGARAYIRTRFSYSTDGGFWAGFTYDAYCEAADSGSVMAFLTQRNTANASCMSLASTRGCSSDAKWPPTGISVHLATLNTRSTHSRGGLIISLGNRA